MTAVKDFIALLHNSDRLRIMQDGKEVFVGYLSTLMMDKTCVYNTVRDCAMKEFRAVPEIRHKQWQERGLMEPLMKHELAEYSFSDLQMNLYYTIILKDENKERIEELHRIIMEHEECCKGCPDSGHQEACECCDVYGNIMDFQRELQGLEE